MTPENAIKKLVKLLREFYKIDIYPNFIEKMCNECDTECFKFAIKNQLEYEQINLTSLGFTEPFHRASILGFNINNKSLWYLIDPTYGQFFENEEFKEYMLKHNYPFATQLLNSGYIDLTIPNILSYIDGFMHSYNKNMDSALIYQNLFNLLIQNKIIDPTDPDLLNINNIKTKK